MIRGDLKRVFTGVSIEKVGNVSEVLTRLPDDVNKIAAVVVTLIFLGIFVSILMGSGQLTIGFFNKAAEQSGVNVTVTDYTQQLNVGTVFSMSNIVIIMSMVALVISVIIALYHYFNRRV